MHPFRHAVIITVLVATISIAISCRRKPANQRTPPVKSGNVLQALPNPVQYVECDEREAETTLNVKVSIASVMKQQFVLPLKRQRLYDDQGRLLFTPELRASVICDDGTMSGHGIGFSGSVDLVGATDHDVTIAVNFGWTAPDNSRGDVDRNVTIQIGQHLEQQLSKEVLITASFRDGGRR